MTGEAPARAQGDGTLLRLRVQPRASRSGVDGVAAGRVRVRLTAPPVEGAANDALLRLLADLLATPRTRLELVAGQGGREKAVFVPGLAPPEVLRRLGLMQAAAAPRP